MDEAGTTSEQLALIGFAARLGTCVSQEDGSIATDGDLRQDAQLLMSLMTSTSTTSVIDEPLSSDEEIAVQSSNGGHDDLQNSGSHQQSFAFSCPSLSLDASSFQTRPSVIQRQVTDGSSERALTHVQPPAVLLSRPLGVDDRDAMRLSAEAMARNMLQSFHTAVQWRIDTWVSELAESLVLQERDLLAQGASQDDLRELLSSSEALVLASLKHRASKFDVLDARTSYRVRPQRMEKDSRISSPACTAPPAKKRKLETDSDKVYSVSHALSFQTVLNLSTSAGFTEVTLEAPGIIEGTFTITKAGEETLTGVSVQIDTRVLARMMEKSSRIVVRTATHSCLEAKAYAPAMVETEAIPECLYTTQLDLSAAPSTDADEPSQTGVVTPRYPSPKPTSYGDSDPESMDKFTYFPLPDDLEQTVGETKAFLRMVSPQPRSQEQSFAHFRTPTSSKILVPSLVSPQPFTETLPKMDTSGPSLPALVEAACNAMRISVA